MAKRIVPATDALLLNSDGSVLAQGGTVEIQPLTDNVELFLVSQADGTPILTVDSVAVFAEFDANVGIRNQNELRFYDNGNYVGFEAPALSADQIWVLPDADGGAGEYLQTDGGGNLSWAAGAGGAPVDAQYVVMALNGVLTQERVLTGTANQVIVTDGGAGGNVTLSTPQDIAAASTPTFGGLTINGAVGIHSNNELRFYDNGNYVGFEAPALGGDQIWVLPAADGGANEFLQTDGGGNLSWAAGGGAPVDAQYVVLALNGVLTQERVLTGTANQITVTDGGAGGNVTLSTPQDIHSGATPTFAGLTANGAIGIHSSNELRFYDNGNYVGFEAPALTGDQIWVLPDADGGVGEFLQTDGGGNLSWAAGGGGAPGGANKQVQYNNAGAFGGATGFEWQNASPNVLVTAQNAAHIALEVVAAAMQAADIFEIQDSAAGILAGADERGILFCDGDTEPTNLFMGSDAGNNTATGEYNVGLGDSALQDLTDGQYNTCVGASAGADIQGGDYNICVGYLAGLTITSGGSNVLVGVSAGQTITTASGNIGIGTQALLSNTSGVDNVGVGFQAGYNTTLGSYNVMMGRYALLGQQTGSYNVAIGYGAGQGPVGLYNTSYNVLLGAYAGLSAASGVGSNNVMIGFQAGLTVTGGTNVLIGYQVASTAVAISNQLWISNSSTTTPLVYGEFDGAGGYGVRIHSPATTAVVLTARGIAYQAANLFNCEDSAGTVLTFVGASGMLGIGDGASDSSTRYAWIDGVLTGSTTCYGMLLAPMAGTGVTSTLYGLYARTDVNTSITCTNSYAIFIANPTGAGTFTNVTGLNIQSITAGASVNRAIYTNAGLVHFGDATEIYGSTAASVQFTVRGAASQSGELTVWENSSGTNLMEVESTGCFDFRWGMGNSSKNPAVDACADWVQIKIAGTTYYLPAYAA